MSLIGKKVIIIVSDPWDFQTEYPEPLEGKIIIANSDLTRVGVLVTKEFKFEKKLFSYTVCSCRRAGQTFENLSPKGTPCTIVGLTQSTFDLYWSSGKCDYNKSVNLLGSIELK